MIAMNQPAIAVSAPTLGLRRAIDWWLAQVRHVLPPTIFFFVGFNLILWTKRLVLEEHGIDFSGFFTATLAALLVGKAVLATDHLPFMRRFDGAPMIQPIIFKTAIYWLCILIVRLAEELVQFLANGRTVTDFPTYLIESLVTVFVHPDMVDGAVPCLCYNTRTQHALRRRRTLSPFLPLAFIRSQAHPPSACSPAHPTQPVDRGELDRSHQQAGFARIC